MELEPQIELSDGEIAKRVADMKSSYEEYEKWNIRVRSEQDSMNHITQRKTFAVGAAQKQYCEKNGNDIELITHRARAIGNAINMNSKSREQVFDDILQVFKQFICSKTHVIVDADKEKVLGSQNTYSAGNASITVGKFGFGLRRSINSQQIRYGSDVRYVLKNHVAVCKGLRAKKLAKQADMIEDLMKIMENLGDLGSGGMTLGLENPVSVPLQRGRFSEAHSVKFGQSYSDIVLISKDGSASANPNRGALCFATYYLAHDEIVKALAVAEERVKNMISIEETSKRVKDVLGKWLLLSSL